MLWRILGNVFLGDIESILTPDELSQVTHVVSVVNGDVPAINKPHLHIDIADDETANLLQELPRAMSFIEEALFNGDTLNRKKHHGLVLIHCAQAVLRSVAVIVAFLMYNYKLSYTNALYAVKRRKDDVGPNLGFAMQVQLFADMDFVVDKQSQVYLEFLIQLLLAQDPTGEQLRLLQVYKPREAKYDTTFTLRCKRCRHPLAGNDDVEPHDQPGKDLKQAKFIKTAGWKRWVVLTEEASSECSHWFLPEPLEWMKSELGKSEIEGKLHCEKCEAKVGGYSWQGLRCLCGRWMVPAIHLNSAKVDQIGTVNLDGIRVQHESAK